MTRQRAKWQLVAALTVGACIAVATLGRAQQFTTLTDRRKAMLEGNWQSCREDDGKYAERVYDGKWPGLPEFELHMGPFHDFALFLGIQDDHRDHNSADNLLKPHTLEPTGGSARHAWDAAGLHFEATLAGGSRDTCESWYVTLVRSAISSSSY